MEPALTRFWFKFKRNQSENVFGLGLGCGVTAYNREDAINILQQTVFEGKEFPEIEEVTENVSIPNLDQKHVVPNMEAPVWRGVWFPKGFAFKE